MPYYRGSARDLWIRRAIVSTVDANQMDGVLPNLVGQDQMFGPPGMVPDFDLELPTPPRGRSRDLLSFDGNTQIQLIGQDIINGSPGEVPDYDWQLPPRARGRSRDLLTFDGNMQLQLIGQDQINGAPGEVPDYDTPAPPRGRPRAIDLTFMYPSTLQVLTSIASPFIVTPTPDLYARGATRARDYTFTDQTNVQLIGQDATYGAPGESPAYDWQLPPRSPGRSRDLLSQDVQTPLQLIGQDQVYGGPGQVPSYDWQRAPRGAPRVVDASFEYPSTIELLTAGAVITLPNGLQTFDLAPRGTARAREYSFAHLTDQQLIGQDQVYGASGEAPAYDWLVPRGYSRGVALRVHVDVHSNDTLFGQDVMYDAPGEVPTYDWIVPRGYARSTDPRTIAMQLVNTTLLGQDQIFGAAGEAPSYDWQLSPRGAARARDYTFSRAAQVQLIGLDQVYGAPGQSPAYDWQLSPRGRVSSARWIWNVLGYVALYSSILPPPVADATFRVQSRGLTFTTGPRSLAFATQLRNLVFPARGR